MIEASCDTPSGTCTVVVRPNQSLTGLQAGLFWAGIAVVTLTVAFGFAALGHWPVVPFAGLELCILAWALRRCLVRGQWREVVSVCGDTVEVAGGRRGPEWSARFQRAWVRTRLRNAGTRGYPSRLTLGSHGREIELAAFVTDEERERLAGILQSVIRDGALASGTAQAAG